MNKLYRILIQTFIVTNIAMVATNACARSGGDDGDKPLVFDRNHSHGVIPPQAKLQGKSYGDWGAEWFKWAVSFPYDQNPFIELTGQYQSLHQKGPVWFLGGGGDGERSLNIPAGKFIFFPVVNLINDYPCPDPTFHPAPGQTMEDFLTFGTGTILGATDYIDPWVATDNTMSVKVDGVEVKNLRNYRGLSRLTKFKADPSEVALDSCMTGTEQDMVSDGFWIMLAPLKPGNHTIKLDVVPSTLNNPWFDWGFYIHATYHVKVSNEHK